MNSELKPMIDKQIEVYFDSLIEKTTNKNIYNGIKAFVLNAGKRLRPIFLINAYHAVSGTNVNITKASLSVEFLHNSTLIHDDIMDEDDVRRNKPTIHKLMKDDFLKKHDDKPARLFNSLSTRHAVTNAICSGNILYSLGMSVLSEANAEPQLLKKAAKIYSHAYTIVNDGQILDNQFELTAPTELQYLDMIEQKTANLFKAAVEIGAVLGNATEAQITALSNYAAEAATAFQLQDDLLDLTKEKGNTFGSDIRKGKHTLILIKALQSATDEQKQQISQALGNNSATDEQITQVITIFQETGAINQVKNLAKDKIEQAKSYLDKAEPQLEQKPKEFFLELADFMFERSN